MISDIAIVLNTGVNGDVNSDAKQVTKMVIKLQMMMVLMIEKCYLQPLQVFCDQVFE